MQAGIEMLSGLPHLGCKQISDTSGIRIHNNIALDPRYQENNQMNIRPLHDRVVVRRSEEETTTAGGIVLPGSAAEKPNRGEVVAVGPGRTLNNGDVQAPSVKVGDKILFGQYAGSNTVKVDGDELLIMQESEIYGVLED